MKRQWHHGHSIGAGVLGGIIISRRPELVFVTGFGAGALFVIGIYGLRSLVGWIQKKRIQHVTPNFLGSRWELPSDRDKKE